MRMIDRLMELATDRERDVWLQCRALDGLRLVAFNSLPAIFEERLSHESTDDDMFVRRHVIRAIAASEASSFPSAQRSMHSLLAKAASIRVCSFGSEWRRTCGDCHPTLP